MDKEIFVKKIQVSGILFKYNVPINEAKIIGTFIEELEQQCKKQKEVIDKAINWTIKYQTEWCQEDEVIRDLKQLLDILKEK